MILQLMSHSYSSSNIYITDYLVLLFTVIHGIFKTQQHCGRQAEPVCNMVLVLIIIIIIIHVPLHLHQAKALQIQ
jgi:hypothetical protein